MYRKIVVGYRDHESGAEALELARALAEPVAGEVLIVTVLVIHALRREPDVAVGRRRPAPVVVVPIAASPPRPGSARVAAAEG